MLDLDTRTAILRLANEGHGARTIAKSLNISRGAVRKVLRSGSTQVPGLARDEQLGEHVERVRSLHERCKGNLVRVREELAAEGVEVGYSSLTAFCRRNDIGQPTKTRAGRYHFGPGVEMQHDTSPHKVEVGGSKSLVQCASLVQCYSRVIFSQVYIRWSRFECRAFLTEAIRYMGGAAARCMIDNSSVIIAHGTGRNAVPAAPMVALGERFGFHFEAHAVGDANRSARVERPFDYIERNFYAGRDFADIGDLNIQLRAWCDRVNNKTKRSLPKTPFELLAAERSALQPLPAFVPEIYDLHTRRVDVEGYVALHTNRYSAPATLIGRKVEVRESMAKVRVFDGHELVVEHARRQPGARHRATLPEHQRDGRHQQRVGRSEQELFLSKVSPILGELAARLRKRHGGQALKAVKRLHKMYLDYPTEVLIHAVSDAIAFDLCDLGRIEKMLLRRIHGDYFRLSTGSDEPSPSAAPQLDLDPKSDSAPDNDNDNDNDNPDQGKEDNTDG